jgi:PAT family beta-lactamase induction signal transducer AmpG
LSERAKGWALVRTALGSRKTAAMLVLGFASGLPFVLLIGTLNAWLGELKVSLATIGVLSWIGLAYAFKFLWSPVVDRVRLPGLRRIGRRRSWLVAIQIALAGLLWALAATDPIAAIGSFAGLAVVAAFLSATQDVVIDAWRIEVADERTSVEVLSAIYQLGNRTAALTGGALALVLAARIGWPMVYAVMGVAMLGTAAMTFLAPDTIDPDLTRDDPLAGHAVPDRRRRTIALAIVALGWGWAILMLARFMVAALSPVPVGGAAPSAGDFTKLWGPWIVAATVILPALVAGWAGAEPSGTGGGARDAAQRAADHCYRALILPLGEIVGRLRWGAFLVLALILTYRICDSIWAPFAFPFYLDHLGYSNDEVAFASKLFGVVMTIVGVGLAGVMLAAFGRMPTLLAGAVVAALSNLLYADLATGGVGIDGFAHLLFLDRLGVDARMLRLMLAISGENIAGGLAGAAFVAYISSIVAREYSAVQYALLSSLTFLIGALGRAAMGEAIEQVGYAQVFLITAVLGTVAVVLVLAEWWRGAPRVAPAASEEGAPEPA